MTYKRVISIIFFAALLLCGCKTLDNKVSTVLFSRYIINKDFICDSDTSICNEGIVLGTSKFNVSIENLKFNRISRVVSANMIVIDNNDSVPDVLIIRGKLLNNKIFPLKVVGMTNKKGIAKVKFCLSSNEVIYLLHVGYSPIVYKLRDILHNI